MTVRTAIVGAGTVSDVHLSGLHRCPLTELVAVCDLDGERARAAAEEYDSSTYTDVDALLAEESLDWIHLCTSVQSHLPLARKAIEAGVPVQIEKPIVETAEDMDELQSLSERHGVPVSEVQQHLFDPALREVNGLVESGALGTVRGVDTIYAGLTSPDESNRGEWVFELAGGEFEEGLPHPIYVTLRVGGYPRDASDVSATTSLIHDYDRDFAYDGAQVQYVSEGNRLCSIKLVAGCGPQKLVHVHGEAGSVTADLISQTVIDVGLNYDGSTVAKVLNNLGRSRDRIIGTVKNGVRVARTRLDDDWESVRDVTPHYYQIDAEARALATDGEMPVPLDQSRWTVELMEAIRDHPETTMRLD